MSVIIYSLIAVSSFAFLIGTAFLEITNSEVFLKYPVDIAFGLGTSIPLAFLFYKYAIPKIREQRALNQKAKQDARMTAIIKFAKKEDLQENSFF